MTLVEDLLKLYRVDQQVRGLRGRLNQAERYLAAQNRLIGELEQEAEEIRSRRRQLEATNANLENEIRSIDERIEKLRDQLNHAVNNKEYSAFLTELNTIKADRSEVEDRMLEAMERIEGLGSELETVETKLAERSKVRDVARQDLEQRKNDVGERLAELEAERSQAAAAIPEKELAVFEDVAEAHDGEAMARIEEISRRHREYACGECNMTVPFEAVALLTGSGNTMVRCPACERILYMHEETRGALVNK